MVGLDWMKKEIGRGTGASWSFGFALLVWYLVVCWVAMVWYGQPDVDSFLYVLVAGGGAALVGGPEGYANLSPFVVEGNTLPYWGLASVVMFGAALAWVAARNWMVWPIVGVIALAVGQSLWDWGMADHHLFSMTAGLVACCVAWFVPSLGWRRWVWAAFALSIGVHSSLDVMVFCAGLGWSALAVGGSRRGGYFAARVLAVSFFVFSALWCPAVRAGTGCAAAWWRWICVSSR